MVSRNASIEEKRKYRETYRKINRDKLLEYKREYSKRPEVIARRNTQENILKNKIMRKKWYDSYAKRNPIRFIIRKTKERAIARNIEFSITEQDIIYPEFCPLTGAKLEVNSKNYLTSASLDRIDNSKGYIPGNVRVISRQANTLKSNMSIDFVEKLLAYMKGEI